MGVRDYMTEHVGDGDPTAAVREQYAAVAAAYRSSAVHARGPDLDRMIDLLAPSGTERAVDLGTGTGHAAVRLAAHVAAIDAVDLVPEMLAEAAALAAERGVENVAWHEADVRALPFPDRTFDLAVTRVSAHHWADVAAGIREAARVLRPGARMVVIDTVSPADPGLDSFINAVELLRDPSHGRDLSMAEWGRILEEAGFAVDVSETAPIELDAADWFARSRTAPWREEAARRLLREATPAARITFSIGPDGARFALIRGIIRATRR
jgi:ubiquinone/menaquinone biosynthesis C-methylase UbiE